MMIMYAVDKQHVRKGFRDVGCGPNKLLSRFNLDRVKDAGMMDDFLDWLDNDQYEGYDLGLDRMAPFIDSFYNSGLFMVEKMTCRDGSGLPGLWTYLRKYPEKRGEYVRANRDYHFHYFMDHIYPHMRSYSTAVTPDNIATITRGFLNACGSWMKSEEDDMNRALNNDAADDRDIEKEEI